MSFTVRRLCSMARAGWARKRSSSRSREAFTLRSSSLTRMIFSTEASRSLLKGSRRATLRARNTELTRAMLTGLITRPDSPRSIKAERP